ncbi:MAG: AAA family ATPase [Acidobacteriaceae bacterium]|nr:AAA family ATPase [Acidobacteriaceae bacterium]
MTKKIPGFASVVLLTIGTNPATRNEVTRIVRSRAWLIEEVHAEEYFSAQKRPSFGPQLHDADYCIVLIDFEKNPEQAAETTRYLNEAYGNKVLAIAVVKSATSDLILTALRAGCSELISEPIQQTALDTVLNRLENVSATNIHSQEDRAKVITLVGAKGGVGTTTLAVHLAIFLAKRHGKRTLLIDQHLSGGHVSVYLGLDSSGNHFEEVVRNLARMDSELLHRFVAKHESGVEVLTSPDTFRTERELEPEAVRRALDFLASEYEYIVIDCNRVERALSQPVFSVSQTVYLVASPDVAAARDLARMIDELVVLEESSEKTRILLNRSNSPFAIDAEYIERATRQRIAVRIPNAYPGLIRAANLGEPLGPGSNGDVPLALAQWSDEIVGAPARRIKAGKEQKRLTGWLQSLTAQSSSAS